MDIFDPVRRFWGKNQDHTSEWTLSTLYYYTERLLPLRLHDEHQCLNKVLFYTHIIISLWPIHSHLHSKNQRHDLFLHDEDHPSNLKQPNSHVKRSNLFLIKMTRQHT